jgi:hypothetical protein
MARRREPSMMAISRGLRRASRRRVGMETGTGGGAASRAAATASRRFFRS